jgi:ATP-dependent Clp protease ATP-binding subunit ClpA
MRRERDDRRPPLERLIDMGATDLTARVHTNQLSRAYGRDAEIEQFTTSLVNRQSVLLLGPAEVGKTAILHEVACRCVWKQGPDELHGHHVVSISTGGILAGTEYLGDWQTRLTDLLEAVKQAGDILLFIEDIWGLRDAGRASDKADGFSSLVRPYLERHDVILLGESTEENYHTGSGRQRGLADEPSLMKWFNVIRVEPTSPERTRPILVAVARGLQRAHKVRIEAAALDRALELTRRYLPYQAFPGKAVRLLDETARTCRDARERDTARPASGELVIGTEEVSAGFSRMTGLPEKMISDRIPLTQEMIRAYFEERVIGQDEAIAAVLDMVTLIKAELQDPNRPLGVLFFVGPTGVGKTELAKTLAEFLFGGKDKLMRFDMSEFKTAGAYDALLRQVTETQRAQNFSVLLLDEIEKANGQVFDLFLSAFDDARLTDSDGRSVDLRNTIVVMTSNLGSDLVDERPTRAMGFVDEAEEVQSEDERQRAILIETVKAYFRPEFINRLDHIVTFRPLGMDAMRRIARRELGKALLREGVLRRNILLDYRDEVIDVLLATGFTKEYGARQLQRTIRDKVLLPLARTIAAQPGSGEQLLELCARDGQIVTQIIPSAEPLVEPPVAPESEVTHGAAERSADLRELREELDQLYARVEEHLRSERFHTLESQAEALLAEVGQPAFWDDQERSRRILTAIHRMEQVKARFPELRDRIEGTQEVANMIQQHADVTGPRELASIIASLRSDLLLAELELDAGGQEASAAEATFVCITPLVVARAQDAGAWARSLGEMYLAWARRKGYDAEAVNAPDGVPLLLIQGPNVHRMLQGEQGVHKIYREVPKSDQRYEKLRAAKRSWIEYARVEVMPAPAWGAPAEPESIRVTVKSAGRAEARNGSTPVQVADAVTADGLYSVRVRAANAGPIAGALLSAQLAHPPRGEALAGTDELVRVYYLTRGQHVRDPRTEERQNRPRDVLAGAIEPFLFAWLEAQRTSGDSPPGR